MLKQSCSRFHFASVDRIFIITNEKLSFDVSFKSHPLYSLDTLKVDADDSSNEWWRSDQEDELIRLISTPIVDAISKIDSQQNDLFH
jgi:hypothetical protein